MDKRTLQYKKTAITVHFTQEVDTQGVVQTTARADFLREAPGVCTPLTVTATENTRERALQALIHKIHRMIADGVLVYKEHRFDPSTANIFKAPQRWDPTPPPQAANENIEKKALDSIMKVIEENLAFGGGTDRPLGAILDQIIHDAARALILVGYYEDFSTLKKCVKKVVDVMEAREGKR